MHRFRCHYLMSLLFAALATLPLNASDHAHFEESSGLMVEQGVSARFGYNFQFYPRIERLHFEMQGDNYDDILKHCNKTLTEARKKLEHEGNLVWDTTSMTSFRATKSTHKFPAIYDCSIYYVSPEAISQSRSDTIFKYLKDRTFRGPWNKDETFTIAVSTRMEVKVWGHDQLPEHLSYTPELSIDPIAYSFGSPAVTGKIYLGYEIDVLEGKGLFGMQNNDIQAVYVEKPFNDNPDRTYIPFFSPVSSFACGQINQGEGTAHRVRAIQGTYLETSEQRNYQQAGTLLLEIFDQVVAGKDGHKSKIWISYTPKAHIEKKWGYHYWVPEQKKTCNAVPLYEVKNRGV